MRAAATSKPVDFKEALEQLSRALDTGANEVVSAIDLRDVDLAESTRHGGTTRSRRSTAQVALDRVGKELERQRSAVRPEIDLSPFSPKMLAMDQISAELGVDFRMLKTNLAAIHHVSSLENLGNAGLPRASLGGLFDCEFIRDSTSMARDVGHEFPDLFRALVIRAAALQGQRPKARLKKHHAIASAMIASKSTVTIGSEAERKALKELVDVLLNRFRREEQEGRIFHENRNDARGAELESSGWGFPYYGATDTPAGFISSAWRYLSLYPDTSFLDSPVVLDEKIDPSRTIVTARESIVNALKWVVNRIDDRRGGELLWNQKMEGHEGIANQSWMDSGDSFEFSDKGAYAPVELQGMAYDSLIMGAEMLEAHPGEKGPSAKASLHAAKELRQRADKLRAKFFEDFAIHNPKDQSFEMFAHSVRYGDDGTLEQSRWMKSNAGRLLDSRLFDTDDPKILAMRDKLVERLFQPDMVGPFGLIRTMSSEHPRYNPLAYHNGSIWPTDNMAIAHGLLRQAANSSDPIKARDFQEKAESLMRGILNACAAANEQGFPAPEWIPGDAGVSIPQKEEHEVGEDGKKRITKLSPMRIQGWTVTAMWASASYLADRRLKEEDEGYVSGTDLAKSRRVPMPQEYPAERQGSPSNA